MHSVLSTLFVALFITSTLALSSCSCRPTEPTAPPIVADATVPTAEDDSSNEIESKLQQAVSLEAIELPLADAIQKLAEQCAISIKIDEPALDKLGIGSDTPVTCQFRNVSLDDCLKELLEPLGLVHVVKDGAIIVTAP